MDLLVIAVPLFIFAIGVELAYGLATGRNTYRLNDSISSLFLGVLSQARRFVTLGIGGYIYYLLTRYFSLPLMDVGAWYTWVIAFVVYDFCYYWLHRMGHERTILWAAHVAHHQSEDYNLTTALRQTSSGFLLSWVFYIPMYLLGMPVEVVVTVGALSLIYQFWVHSEHIPKLGWYEKFFVTASNHRVHHAQNDIYLDRNYGGVFIIWDRLFGTFQEELDDEPSVYGIRGPLQSWNPVKALTHIYVDMAKDSWRTASWGDKLRVWVGRTGWRPADVAERWPSSKNDLSTFEKYNPVISRITAVYCFAQLIAVVVLLNYMQQTDLPYWMGAALWAFMLATTVTTALWLQRHDPVALFKWELLRLVGWFCLIDYLWFSNYEVSALMVAATYGGLNLMVLPIVRRKVDAPQLVPS
ncbi:MAG: sterol desaturase family protein [Halioglobus sp.]